MSRSPAHQQQLLLDDLGNTLRRLRAERRLTVEALTRRSGLGRTTVSQALNGRSVPSEDTVVALAKVLRTDAGPLLELRARADAAAVPDALNAPTSSADAAFEERYRRYVIDRYRQLTVVGLDLSHPGRTCWPLDTAYLSLELADSGGSGARSPERDAPLRVERAERALAGKERTLVRGLAGSGKTTLLQWLAVATARRQLPQELASLSEFVPFVLPLRALVRQAALPPPDRFLSSTGSMLAAAQPAGWADRVLTAGRGLLLIDGIDEVPQQSRDHTRQWLAELLATYPRGRFLVTTRPSAVPEGWLSEAAFAELTVRPMNRQDITVFVTRWHSAVRSGLSDQEERAAVDVLEANLKDAIRAQHELAELATTPLMCALICALHRDRRGHLPNGRMELYEAALSMLLVRRDNERGIATPEGIELTQHQSVQLLQRLAYWLIRNGQSEMDQETALGLLDEALPAMPDVSCQGDTSRLLSHLVSRSGLLRRPSADTIEFVHRTFQDYLGAKAAVEARDLGLLVRQAHDDLWEDVLRMAVAHARPSERATLLRRLITRGDRTAKHRTRLHLLAMACLEQATELDPAVRAEVESRTAALLPPRSWAEARKLAAAGRVILGLLPGPDGLAEDEARAVAQTARMVGGNGVAVLKRFRNHPSRLVASELALSWVSFDIDEYAEEVLSHVTEPDVQIYVERHAQLKWLGRLTQQSRLSFNGPFTPDDVLAALTLPQVTHLSLAGPCTSDISYVRSLPSLRDLHLSGFQSTAGLSPIAQAPLTNLALWHGQQPISLIPLTPVTTLRELNLNTPLIHDSVQHFPSLPELRRLYVWERTCETTRLVGISRYQSLEFVSYVSSMTTSADHAEIARLPKLSAMQLYLQDVRRLATHPVMPNVTTLTLNTPLGYGDLTPVKHAFPGLKRLVLFSNAEALRELDLSPLSDLDGLTVSITDADHVLGTEAFPPGTVTLRPRPRA